MKKKKLSLEQVLVVNALEKQHLTSYQILKKLKVFL